jgi:hypothetical protein
MDKIPTSLVLSGYIGFSKWEMDFGSLAVKSMTEPDFNGPPPSCVNRGRFVGRGNFDLRLGVLG